MSELPRPTSGQPLSLANLRPELHGRGEHLLHVDDEPTVTLSIQRLLQKIGYQVASFNTPHAALAHFHADPHRFHLVLTDLMMPEMNGLQFTSEILAVRPGLPVVMLSAFGAGYSSEEIRRSGIREIIAKPATLATIAASLRRVLDSHSS